MYESAHDGRTGASVYESAFDGRTPPALALCVDAITAFQLNFTPSQLPPPVSAAPLTIQQRREHELSASADAVTRRQRHE